MHVKPISDRTMIYFMSVFINQSRKSKSVLVSLQSDAIAPLRQRSDFCAVLLVLQGLGYIQIHWANVDHPYRIKLTDSGLAYLESNKSLRKDQRWTRGLAIVAILISLVALILEFDSRGYLEWLKPEKTHAELCSSTKSESQ